MELSQFKEVISQVCESNTSISPKDWTKQRSTSGHCAVVALLAQELFGGTIVKVNLLNTPYEKLGSHFFNVINGTEQDFTLSQFTEHPYKEKERHERAREAILAYPGTLERFELLKSRFLKLD